MIRDQAVLAARRWVDTPYRHKGRSDRGLDCIGLAVVVARSFGIAIADEENYTNWADPQRRLLKVMETHGCRIAHPESPFPGTIGIFSQAGLPGHVGIFSRKHGVVHLIHAHIRHRRVVEEPYASRDPELRLIRRYELPGLED